MMISPIEWILILLFLIPLAFIVGGTIIVVKLLGRGGSQEFDEEEMRAMQELYQGLERMEKRVESLETILLEHERERGEERIER